MSRRPFLLCVYLFFCLPLLDWVGSCMNEKEPPFSPVFYILLHFLFSFPVLLPSCESSGLGVVM